MEGYNVVPFWFAIIAVVIATIGSIGTFFDEKKGKLEKTYIFMMLAILYTIFYKNYF